MYFPSFQSKKRGHMKEEIFLTFVIADMHFLENQQKGTETGTNEPAYCRNVCIGIDQELMKSVYLV